ncbi:MAG: hypothetical protein ACI8QT_001780 [Halioglobus sp.]|jgi:hypothetical protein
MDDYFLDEDTYEDDVQEEKFIALIDKLSAKNRKLHVRREIERREELQRLRDALGIENFELEMD